MPAPAILELERKIFLRSGIDVDRPLPSVPQTVTAFERAEVKREGEGGEGGGDMDSVVDVEAKREVKAFVPLSRAVPKGKGHKAKMSSAGSSMSWLDEIKFSTTGSRQPSSIPSTVSSRRPSDAFSHSRSLSATTTFQTIKPDAGVAIGRVTGASGTATVKPDKSIIRISSLRRPSDGSIDGVLPPHPRMIPQAKYHADGTIAQASTDRYPLSQALPVTLSLSPSHPPRTPSRHQNPAQPSPISTSTSPKSHTVSPSSTRSLARKTKSVILTTRHHVRAASESSAQVIGFAGKQAKEAGGKALRFVEEVRRGAGAGNGNGHGTGSGEVGDGTEIAVSGPAHIRHDLHVSKDLSGLPSQWRDILWSEGVSQHDLDRIIASRSEMQPGRSGSGSGSGRKQVHKRGSRSLPEVMVYEGVLEVRPPDVRRGEYEVPDSGMRGTAAYASKKARCVAGAGYRSLEEGGPRERTLPQSVGHEADFASATPTSATHGGSDSTIEQAVVKRQVSAKARRLKIHCHNEAGLGDTLDENTCSGIESNFHMTPGTLVTPSTGTSSQHNPSTQQIIASTPKPTPCPLLRLSSSALEQDWAEEVLFAISRSKNRSTAEWKLVRLPSDWNASIAHEKADERQRFKMKDKQRRERKEARFRQFQEGRKWASGGDVGEEGTVLPTRQEICA